jgi:signal transduction histidine kinase
MLGLLREADRMDGPPPLPPPRPARLRRRDVTLACGAVALAIAERHVYGDLALVGPPGSTSPLSFAITALTAGTVAMRRRAPGTGATLAAAGFLAGAMAGRPVTGGTWMLVTLGGLAYAAAVGGRRSALGAVALFVSVLAAQAWRYPTNLTVTGIIVAVPAVAGALVAWRSARGAVAREQADRDAAQLEAARQEAVRRERLSMARELHDVVSHAVGVMVVQAGAAEALHPVDADRSSAALRTVEHVAREALVELDRMVTVIGQGAVGRLPPARGVETPTLSDLESLVDRMRRAGLRVELRLPESLDAHVAPAVYRIVQESLTNVLRHAAGARVWVDITEHDRAVFLEVRDDGPGPGAEAGCGYGLVGIRERVQRLGGELTAGAGPRGRGFAVQARLPLLAGRHPQVTS